MDDLMFECSKDQRMSELFTKSSHHRGMSVMYLAQNLFPPGKQSRTISLNSHYMIIFKNPRDSLGMATLARQMYPNNVNYLLESFTDATQKPYGYLMLDLHQLIPENLRVRTNIEAYLSDTPDVSHVIINMSKRMKDNLAYIQVLAKCKPKIRKILVQHGPVDLVKCICECSFNLLKGVIPLTSSQKRILPRYKKHLRILAEKKVSLKNKK